MSIVTSKSKICQKYFKSLSDISDANLTEIELKIMDFVAQGMSNKEIAKYLYISPHTVKAHIATILKKLSAANRTQAVYFAMKLHIIE